MTRLGLITALLRRELGQPAIALLAAVALLAIWAGDTAIGLLNAPLAGPFDGAVARFPTTIQVAAGLLVILRISVRGQDDHSNGWLVPYLAAGGSRWLHGIAVAAVTALSMWLLVGVGAGSFALTLLIVGDSADVLRIMPLLMLSAGLGLLGLAMLTTLVSLTVRDATATICVTFLLMGLPFVMLMNAMLRDTALAPWVELLLRVMPTFFIPGTTGGWLTAIGFTVVGMAAAAALGHLRTARYA